MPHLCKTD